MLFAMAMVGVISKDSSYIFISQNKKDWKTNPFILPILLVTAIQHLFQQNQFQNLHKFQLSLYLKKNIVQMYHVQNYKP